MNIRSMNSQQKLKLCRELIREYKMKPLTFEGGFYLETFRSDTCSSILFLITRQNFSRLHRLPTAEIYNFYFGDPVNMINIARNGKLAFITLGNNFETGEKFQHVVPGGCWQASYLSEGGVFAMMGTIMAPAFKIGDFEDATKYKQTMLDNYPDCNKLLEKLI